MYFAQSWRSKQNIPTISGLICLPLRKAKYKYNNVSCFLFPKLKTENVYDTQGGI